MVLLPVVYVALIVAAGFGLKYYAVHGTALFEVRAGGGAALWLLALYLAPLIAGAIMIAFMIKPLFAPAGRRSAAFTLDLATEPRLRHLIAAVCARVGAPMPVQVDIDCRVNASAGLRRGLLSLGRNDLVLTIGLPLAQNLTARQFAGVLAHEFGHFNQGTGMAFTYIIGSINHWFARVVFERDEWDETLAQWTEEADSRVAIILATARGAVWCSRKILHGLMLVGRAITCLQLRQMEYDADYYSAHIAGSAAFNDTSAELRRLNVAGQVAFNELGRLWNERQLVDDFPALVRLRRSQLDPELVQKIDASPLEEKTGWLDTHPRDIDRGTQVRALRLPGLFAHDGPATGLFSDFAALSRTASLHFYREQLDLNVDKAAIVATTTVARELDAVAADDTARHQLLGPVPQPTRPIVWTAEAFAPLNLAPAELPARLAALRERLAQLRPVAETAATLHQTLHEELAKARHARTFHAAQILVPPDAFGLGLNNLAQAEQVCTRTEASLAAKRDELAPFESAFREWVALAARAARDPAIAARLPEGLAPQVEATTQSLLQLAPWFRALPGWIDDHSLLSVLGNNESGFGGNRAFAELLQSQREKARRNVLEAPGLVTAAPYPFRTPGGPTTVTEHLARALNGTFDDARHLVLIRTAAELHLRLLGQATRLAAEVERAITTPSPMPPPSTP